MPRKSIDQQLAELEARTQKARARVRKRDRTRDTRRKILLGAFLLKKLETEQGTNWVINLLYWLRRELPKYLTRERDHDLFTDIFEGGNESGQDETPVENRSIDLSEGMKRLAIDIPETLHRKIKTKCSANGTRISDAVRELLVQKFEDN